MKLYCMENNLIIEDIYYIALIIFNIKKYIYELILYKYYYIINLRFYFNHNSLIDRNLLSIYFETLESIKV